MTTTLDRQALQKQIAIARAYVEQVSRERTALPEVRKALAVAVQLAAVALQTAVAVHLITTVPEVTPDAPKPIYYLDDQSIDLELFLEGPWGKMLTPLEITFIRGLEPGGKYTIAREKIERTRPVDFHVVSCKAAPIKGDPT